MVKKFFALRKGPTDKVVFTAQVSNGDLEILVYDVIGADFFNQGVTSASVAQAIKDAGQFNNINLRINSPGGDAFEGIAIYNILKATGKTVNVYVDGLAASAASIIAMAGKVTMGVGAVMMIHNAMMIAYGNGNDFREAADTLDKVSGAIADIYVAATGVAKDKVQKMMDQETWMDATEAVAQGFAVGTEDSTEPQVKAEFDLSIYNNVPESLKTPVVAAEVVAEPTVEPVVSPSAADIGKLKLMRKRLELRRKA